MWQHQKVGLSFLHRNMRLCHETLFILSPYTSGIRGRRCFWFTLIMQSIVFWLTRVHVGTLVTKYFILEFVFWLMVSNRTVAERSLFPLMGSYGFNVQPSRIPRQFFIRKSKHNTRIKIYIPYLADDTSYFWNNDSSHVCSSFYSSLTLKDKRIWVTI